MKSAITGEGTILGTLQYMAPEQVEAKEVDARTDIFAFGTVVYEMATGKKVFEGKTSASVMAKILEAEPPSMASLQPMTPPALDRVVKKCLAKEPDQRWQTASDLCGELKWIAEGGSQSTAPAAATAGRAHMLRRWAAIAGVACLVVIVGLAGWILKPPPPKPVTRTVITLPPGDRLVGPDQPSLALSPDGRQLAYAAVRGGSSQLYLRSMDSLESKPIPGTEGASEPFFSPDGQWLGFFAAQKLKKVSVSGGVGETLGDAALPVGGTWSSKGTIVFAPTANSPLLQVSDAGGAPQPLTHLEKSDGNHIWPEFLPGGKAVLFAEGHGSADSQVAIQSIETGERRNLIGGMQPRYAASGHLIFAQGGTLMAVSYDTKRLEIKGTPVTVVGGVANSAPYT
jgi:serine/threonine-protein kinase